MVATKQVSGSTPSLDAEFLFQMKACDELYFKQERRQSVVVRDYLVFGEGLRRITLPKGNMPFQVEQAEDKTDKVVVKSTTKAIKEIAFEPVRARPSLAVSWGTTDGAGEKRANRV